MSQISIIGGQLRAKALDLLAEAAADLLTLFRQCAPRIFRMILLE